METKDTKVELPFPAMNCQRKESRPPSYSETAGTAHLPDSIKKPKVWNKQIVLVYVVLLMAVGAAAIYFSISSTKYQGELKKHVNENGEVLYQVERKPEGDDPCSNSLTEGALDAVVVGLTKPDVFWAAPRAKTVSTGDNVQYENPASHEIDSKWASIFESSVKNCTWDDTQFTSSDDSDSIDMTTNIIANLQPVLQYFGIPSHPMSDLKGKLITASYFRCMVHAILLNAQTPALISFIAQNGDWQYLMGSEVKQNVIDEEEAEGEEADIPEVWDKQQSMAQTNDDSVIGMQDPVVHKPNDYNDEIDTLAFYKSIAPNKYARIGVRPPLMRSPGGDPLPVHLDPPVSSAGDESPIAPSNPSPGGNSDGKFVHNFTPIRMAFTSLRSGMSESTDAEQDGLESTEQQEDHATDDVAEEVNVPVTFPMRQN